MRPSGTRPLRILHVFRAPVGGLFRHVLDLASGQAERGHQVGLIADSTTGGERAEEALARLEPVLDLGILRLPMDRQPGRRDVAAIRQTGAHARHLKADVVHGHGAKGGLYARLTDVPGIRAYTPHGGSLNYSRTTPGGFVYLTCESLLRLRTDVFLFESAYAQNVFKKKVGVPRGVARVVHNGIGPNEFEAIKPHADATDLVFVGEFATRKGLDVLFETLALLNGRGRRLTLTAVGSGPEEGALKSLAVRLGLADQITFHAPMSACRAFALGRTLVVPSRAESLPYIVLESIAASVPIIATNVGGVSEIFGVYADSLVPAGNVEALATALLTDPEVLADRTARIRRRVEAGFNTDAMCDGILDAYREGLHRRGLH